MPAWIKFALAVQFALIFALGWQVLQPERTALEYHTLASASAPQHAAGSLVVVFDRLRRNGKSRGYCALQAAGSSTDRRRRTASSWRSPRGACRPRWRRLHEEPAVVLAEPLETDKAR